LKRQYDSGDKAIFCREINDRILGPGSVDYLRQVASRPDEQLLGWLSQYILLHDELLAMAGADKTLVSYWTTVPHIAVTRTSLKSAYTAFIASFPHLAP
jgi:hypothetical protein